VAFKLAELFVDITANDKPAVAGLGRVRGAFDGLIGTVAALAGSAGLGFMLFDATKKAALLNEEISRTNVVLGSSAGTVIDRADQMAAAYGTAKAEYIGAATSFASAMKGAGMSAAQAADTGTLLADLATDLRSFTPGATFQDATTALQAALRGENDPLERFNVFLSAGKVEAEALALGLIKSKNEMTDLAKRTATLSLIMKQTTDAQGDRGRTKDSPWNLLEEATGRYQNTLTELGQNFTPIMASIASTASQVLGGINEWLGENAATISGWVQSIGEGLGLVGWALQNFGGLWQVAGLYADQTMIQIEEMAAWAFGALGQYSEWFGNNWVGLIRDALMAVWSIFQNVFTNIKNIVGAAWDYITNPAGGFNFQFTGLLDGFEASVAQLPEIAAPHLTNLQDQIDGVFASMADKAGNPLAGGLAPGKDPNALLSELVASQQGGAGALAGGAAAAQARTSSLESFASSLITGAFGKDKIAKDQLAVQRETRDILKAGALGGAAGLTVGVAG
jgi:hypothetical protein